MSAKAASRQEIIMNFSTPPSADDLSVLARLIIEALPDELVEKCEDLEVQIEEFPDEAMEQDMELDSPYELLAFYHSGKEISPGVQKKVANDDDRLLVYRRPVLDLWCETGDDLGSLLREVVIEEVARAFEFSEEDIAEMIKRHHQGLF
ncbi:MAG TPA: metallopeptidase family protein [Alphaproteobacteria bacterium]|nr:metallopeptidase family protein [Alphaproteobacteria bacterium]HNS43949.1 metallopeptidase family protein [Alphaproteobacteria bacterium]